MDSHYTFALYALGAAALAASGVKLKTRLELSRAKHRSLTGHVRMARRIASLIPFYDYDEEQFFGSDNAPEEIVARRRAGFEKLSQLYRDRFPESARLTAEIRDSVSDLQFISAYRVPFQYSRMVREHLKGGTFLQSSSGVTVTDLDGNRFYDLTGSYGVNVFGYDFYKECMEQGQRRVRDLGPVLGAYHPVVAYNVQAAQGDLRARRSVVPHVGHRGRDAGGAACPLPHAPHPSRAVQRRLPRLVGRCAAGYRQSGAGARHLHAGGDVRAYAARAAPA